MSSSTASAANCCPPAACLLPDTERKRPCFLQSFIRFCTSATDVGRTILLTQVGFSPVCTSLTSSPCGAGSPDAAAATKGAAVMPFRKSRRLIRDQLVVTESHPSPEPVGPATENCEGKDQWNSQTLPKKEKPWPCPPAGKQSCPPASLPDACRASPQSTSCGTPASAAGSDRPCAPP